VSPVIAAWGGEDLKDPTQFENGGFDNEDHHSETFNMLGSRKNS
jgi:hypothetical protein